MKKIFQKFLKDFSTGSGEQLSLLEPSSRTIVQSLEISGDEFPVYVNEFWTSRQRQASSLHEIAYRACFKGQLPRFFINLLSEPGDVVYDPFSGRGTTIIEAALLGRNVFSNDINPLSRILCYPRLHIPDITSLKERLSDIPLEEQLAADIDLSMFYHPGTEGEIVSLRNYLKERQQSGREDDLDRWIRMVATNRLSGHSKGFFSVYTLPPNQAVSAESQKKINEKRNQIPEYRNVKELILRKSTSLLRTLTAVQRENLRRAAEQAIFLVEDARYTKALAKNSVKLTVTSPPFLDVVQYARDNWLRCWFNGIEADEIASKITMTRKINDWENVMGDVFRELFRITRPGGWVAFEVGEVKGGKIKLEEHVVPLGLTAGFRCEAIVINQQTFTKTSNIWGVSNNSKGTNSNRIVVFRKD
ncbi:MAG: DNA methyltransferase [Calditrichia bacterium]